jgi:ferric-dicitrate binding protein FerR (iron transport regulator)
MLDYTSYSAEELAMDDSFRNWVKHLDQEDVLFWENWVIIHPEKTDAVAVARALVSTLNIPKPSLAEAEIAKEIRQVRRRMAEEDALVPTPLLVAPHRATPTRWWLSAAVLAALLVATALLYFLFWPPSPQWEYATQYGEMKEVTLPDGSKVTLSGNSHLRISPDWTVSRGSNSGGEKEANREVWLHGMAYFKVTHLNRGNAGSHPIKFIVHAGKVNVEVVGTEFNVSNRGEKVKVLLNSGQVQLRIQDRQQRRLAMKPGELFEITQQSNVVRKEKVNARQYTAWKEGELRLDHTSLAEIATIIEEAYGYPVVIASESLKTRQVTGVIQNRDLQFLLQTLSAILSIEAFKEEGKIIFRDTTASE